MSRIAQGSTFTFGDSTALVIKSIDFKNSAKEVDVTGIADLETVYELGTTDKTTTIETLGPPDIEVGDTGTISIGFGDSTAESKGSFVCKEAAVKGSVNGELTTSYTFLPMRS